MFVRVCTNSDIHASMSTRARVYDRYASVAAGWPAKPFQELKPCCRKRASERSHQKVHCVLCGNRRVGRSAADVAVLASLRCRSDFDC